MLRTESDDVSVTFGRGQKLVLVALSFGVAVTYGIGSSQGKQSLKEYPSLLILPAAEVASVISLNEVVDKHFQGVASQAEAWIKNVAVHQTSEFLINPVLCDATFLKKIRESLRPQSALSKIPYDVASVHVKKPKETVTKAKVARSCTLRQSQKQHQEQQ